MTPRLKAALEAANVKQWADSGCSELRELAGAYAAEPQERLEVGQRVRVKQNDDCIHDRGEGTCREPHMYVDWDGQEGEYMFTHLLEPIPDTPEPDPELPADHLDRFWIVGAWIERTDTEGSWCYIVADENGYIGRNLAHEPYAGLKSNLAQTGWSFHPSSPVKEERND